MLYIDIYRKSYGSGAPWPYISQPTSLRWGKWSGMETWSPAATFVRRVWFRCWRWSRPHALRQFRHLSAFPSHKADANVPPKRAKNWDLRPIFCVTKSFAQEVMNRSASAPTWPSAFKTKGTKSTFGGIPPGVFLWYLSNFSCSDRKLFWYGLRP